MRPPSTAFPESARLCAVLFVFVLLSSCRGGLIAPLKDTRSQLGDIRSFLTNPFEPVDHIQLTRARVAGDHVENRVRPAATVTGKTEMTIEDCRSIGLANNPDLRVARSEQLTKTALERSQKKKILPHILLTGQGGEADNQRWGYSEPLGDQGVRGVASTRFPIQTFGITSIASGRERNTWVSTVELNWSPNQAAEAYFLARNSRNLSLDAHHRAVRKAQEIIGGVDAAFFRLLVLQDSAPMAQKLVSLWSKVVVEKRDLYRRGLVNFEEFADAEQKSILASQLLSQISTDLERQRNALASLMNVSPDNTGGGGFTVVGQAPDVSGREGISEKALWDLERVGLQNRPETYEAVLRYLNSANDLKRAFVKYCPEIIAFWRYTRDKDKFLYENDWKEIGVNIRFDFLNFLTAIDESQAGRHALETSDSAIGSIVNDIAAQIRSVALRHMDAQATVKTALASLRTAQAGLEIARKRQTRGDLKKVALDEALADVLGKRLNLLRAAGEQSATLAELHSAMAINYTEPAPGR